MSQGTRTGRQDGERGAVASSRAGHGGGKEAGGHSGRGGHDKHAGHSVAMFRDRFWVSLALSAPVVLYSHMI